jgi:uncharacterized protein (DUF302 family)
MPLELIVKDEFDKTKYVSGTDIQELIETAKQLDILVIRYTDTDPRIIDKVMIFYHGDDKNNVKLFLELLRGDF